MRLNCIFFSCAIFITTCAGQYFADDDETENVLYSLNKPISLEQAFLLRCPNDFRISNILHATEALTRTKQDVCGLIKSTYKDENDIDLQFGVCEYLGDQCWKRCDLLNFAYFKYVNDNGLYPYGHSPNSFGCRECEQNKPFMINCESLGESEESCRSIKFYGDLVGFHNELSTFHVCHYIPRSSFQPKKSIVGKHSTCVKNCAGFDFFRAIFMNKYPNPSLLVPTVPDCDERMSQNFDFDCGSLEDESLCSSKMITVLSSSGASGTEIDGVAPYDNVNLCRWEYNPDRTSGKCIKNCEALQHQAHFATKLRQRRGCQSIGEPQEPFIHGCCHVMEPETCAFYSSKSPLRSGLLLLEYWREDQEKPLKVNRFNTDFKSYQRKMFGHSNGVDVVKKIRNGGNYHFLDVCSGEQRFNRCNPVDCHL